MASQRSRHLAVSGNISPQTPLFRVNCQLSWRRPEVLLKWKLGLARRGELLMRRLIVAGCLAFGLASAADRAWAQAPAAAPEKPKFDQMIEGKTKVTGLWNLYHKDQTLFAEIRPEHIGRDFIVLPTIARGISQRPIIGGMTWTTGDDDMLWSFRKVDDKLMLQRRNVRFKAKPAAPRPAPLRRPTPTACCSPFRSWRPAQWRNAGRPDPRLHE